MFSSSTKREIRHFQVVVVKGRQSNVQKSVIHPQGCCFANLNLLVFFSHSLWRRHRRCLSSLMYEVAVAKPNRRAFCMRMHQYGLLKCHSRATEAFSANRLRLLPAFAACFLELLDVCWELRPTNVFFTVSRNFYGESEFIVVSLSPLRGQSFPS